MSVAAVSARRSREPATTASSASERHRPRRQRSRASTADLDGRRASARAPNGAAAPAERADQAVVAAPRQPRVCSSTPASAIAPISSDSAATSRQHRRPEPGEALVDQRRQRRVVGRDAEQRGHPEIAERRDEGEQRAGDERRASSAAARCVRSTRAAAGAGGARRLDQLARQRAQAGAQREEHQRRVLRCRAAG